VTAQGEKTMPGLNPYSLKNTLVHPLARMTRLLHPQSQVYRLGESSPPLPFHRPHAPSWEVATAVLDPQGSAQLRVNLQRDFWLFAIAAFSTETEMAGVLTFRMQMYDTLKKVRFADRGILNANLGGSGSAPFWLREPYQFNLPDSQVLVTLQNMSTTQNTVQVALYGQVMRFNQ
jgi:hypothetical protein